MSDTVRALLDLMETDAAVGEVYNVGSCQEITILELAERVKQLTESSSEIVFVPFTVAYEENFEDIRRRLPSIKKIEHAIGWRPEVDLDSTLESVIDYARLEAEATHISDRPARATAASYDAAFARSPGHRGRRPDAWKPLSVRSAEVQLRTCPVDCLTAGTPVYFVGPDGEPPGPYDFMLDH